MKGKKKALFVLLMFLPFWTSYVIRSFVWLPILGRNGAINKFLLESGDKKFNNELVDAHAAQILIDNWLENDNPI